jgi:YkoY family integral membrane protein
MRGIGFLAHSRRLAAGGRQQTPELPAACRLPTATMFDQTFAIHDIAVVGLLIVLEGVLSIDNALVLGLLAKRLPRHLQHKALTYGLLGAFAFRVVAICIASLLIQIQWIKLLGGVYLAYVSVKHFFFDSKEDGVENRAIEMNSDGNPHIVNCHTHQPVSEHNEEVELSRRMPLPYESLKPRIGYEFWSAVLVIELTDMAFAVDSILAAVGLVSGRDKAWVVITGGFLGVVLMRFAAALFIKLLERFPRFEVAAYLLVLLIGIKLILDFLFNGEHVHRLNFHDWHSPAFWVFWGLMLACFCVGFVRRRTAPTVSAP